ncbi:MAG: chromosome segregation protein SMC, partial [Verrucomicrobia bacterium]|nr:chromosome segregation protein SMC [Verrucomicrobiota bacterium]
MKLKRLEMEGFKSFCDRTVLDFHEGITAIVGPNGTGKSNILDSIRWVLGEQSAKALRGQEMADVIFHGAAGRKASGMAEVSLIFSDCETILGTDYHEVQITRRVFRDGVSEYALNGTNCRLKDIHRLFLDTGIGRMAYSIMEQGKIDQILSSRPEDRRAIFEEAAGVMRFKVQKREAERKLEGTEANLLRLADILREVRRQIGSLQRQAGKARRHREIFEKLKRLDLALSARERDQLLLKIDDLSSHQAKTKADLDRAHAAEMVCEQGVRAQRIKVEETDRAWRDAEREVVAAQAEEVRCGERASMQTQRADELGGTIERARGEIALAERQTSAQEDLIRSLTAEMEKVTVDFQQAERVCLEAQERVVVARRNREEAVGKMESIRARRESARREAEGARARANAEEVTTRQRSEALDRIREEVREKESEEQREKAGLEELARRLQETESLLPEARQRGQRAEEDLRRAESELASAEKRLSEAEAEKTLAHSREDAMRERSAGEAEVCLRVWTEKGQTGAEAIWPALKVRPGYETAIALALGPVLDGVLVDDLERMAESLEAGEGGTSGILISRQTSGTPVADWSEGAWNFVEGGAGWELLLPHLLAGICIVDTWEEAKGLSQIRPEATIICRDGRMISSRGWQRRGRARSTRPGLHELETARITTERAEQSVREASARVAQWRDQIQLARVELESARTQEQTVRQAFDEVRREHDRREALSRGLSSDVARRVAEMARLEQEIAVHQKIAVEKNSEAEMHLAVEQNLESEARQAEEVRQTSEAEETRCNDLLTERRVDRSAQQQRRDLCASQLNPAETRRKELGELVLKRRDEIAADTARMEGARMEAQASAQAQAAAGKRAQEIEASTSGLKQARETEGNLLTQKEEEVVRWRQDGEKAKDQLAALALKNSQLDHQRQMLADRLQREYATPLMEAKAEGEGMPVSDEDWAKLEEEAKALREKMEEMGPVNTEAISEYEELEGRLKFLETEDMDLTGAKAQLEEAIRKINQTTRLLFEETFDKVRVSFGSLFGELFGGGRATVKMVEGEDSLEGGIDIEAQPPGKQPKNIS